MGAVGITAAEWVRNIRVRLPEVPPECAGVDFPEADDVPVEVGELAGDRPEPVFVVGSEHLSDLVTAVPQHLGDEVAAHNLVEVAEVSHAGGRDAALDDDRFVGVSCLDGVGDGVGPERPGNAAADLVGVFRHLCLRKVSDPSNSPSSTARTTRSGSVPSSTIVRMPDRWMIFAASRSTGALLPASISMSAITSTSSSAPSSSNRVASSSSFGSAL